MWIRAAIAAAVAFAAGLALMAAPAAVAAPNHYAPSRGTVDSLAPAGSVLAAFSVRASGACPAGTTNINAWVDRPAAGWAEVPAISSNTAPDSIITGIPLNNTLIGIASDAGLTLTDGTYEFSLVCYPDFFGTPPTAQFDGAFTITGTTYTWVVPGVTGTTTALAVAPAGGAAAGGPVTLTATVTPSTAVGTVQFKDVNAGSMVDVGTPAPVAGGTASTVTTTLAAGNHSLTAVFVPGTAAFAGSTSTARAYTITAAGQTATALVLTATPAGGAVAGTPVTLTATVSPAAVAGTVVFTDASNGTDLGSAPTSTTPSILEVPGLTAGAHQFVAQFRPDDAQTYAGATSAPLDYAITPVTEPPPSSGGFIDFMAVTTPPDRGAGTSASPITLTTPSGCPVPSDTVAIRLVGPGAWARGVRVSASGALSTDSGFSVQAETIAQTAAAGGLSVGPGKYRYELACTDSLGTGSFGFFVGQLWFYDATSWLNQDPAIVGIPTTTAVTVAPGDRSVVGGAVVLTARVSPAVAGSVTFINSDPVNPSDLVSAKVKDGVATATLTTLPFGLYYVAAVYTPPTTGAKYVGSRSAEVIHAVTRPAPPAPPVAAVVTGSARVGRKLTCTGSFQGATKIAYGWIRDRATIKGAAAAGYTVVVADRGRSLRCQISATNAGGTVLRLSAPMTVTR